MWHKSFTNIPESKCPRTDYFGTPDSNPKGDKKYYRNPKKMSARHTTMKPVHRIIRKCESTKYVRKRQNMRNKVDIVDKIRVGLYGIDQTSNGSL